MEKIKHSSHNHSSSSDDDDSSSTSDFDEDPFFTEDINKSSAELPAEIQHFFHSSHSLALHAIEDNKAVNCDVCRGRWPGFTYRCKDCDFKMDVQCAKLQPEIQLSIHFNHPLTLQDHPLTRQVGDSIFNCDFCNQEYHGYYDWTFHCKLCNFKIELDCARMLLNSGQIKHVSHEHWLGLDVIQSSKRKYCSACREVCDGATYCCKRCHFFLHKSCAEYPTEIKLSLHSDHPLTLGTGTTRERCNFCNLICRALTFRCDMCNFKIDFTCARMLIQFRESVTNGNGIEHYSHQHTLCLHKNKIMDNGPHCYACKKQFSDEYYYCFFCRFYLHGSCSIDFIEHYRDNYKQIQNSFHEHPLEIVYYNSNVSGAVDVCCYVCGERCRGPTYVCFMCGFELHESCLGLLRKINQKSFHKHPLVMIEKNVIDSATCSACGEPCLDPNFICLICKFYFHESCLALPQEIQHFFHPCPLTLRKETTEFTCRACEKIRTQFAFHCIKCHFYLDVDCALMFTENYEGQKYILNPSHGHPLILCNKESNDHVVSCDGCNQVISGQIYGCVKCDFYLHRSCSASPRQIEHPFHPKHPLTLTYDDHKDLCKVSILKTLDERGEVKYLRHKHFTNSLDKQNVCCGACEKRICGPSYDCSKCNFFVHQHCLEPTEELQNPLHLRDRQIGVSRKTHYTRTFRCDACIYLRSGSSYRCDVCKSTRDEYISSRDENENELGFVLDAHCASLKPSVKYEGHKHLLTYFEKIYDDPECEVCKTSYLDASYLRCVECDFNVHFLCVPLPCTIKHKCHIDPLHLVDYFMEDDSDDEDYCDACEESRDPGECVYHCAGCGDYVAHIKCVIDEVLLSLSGKRRGVEFRIVDRNMAAKLSKRGLTLDYIFNSNEDNRKEFEGVEAAIDDLIGDLMSGVKFTERELVEEKKLTSVYDFLVFIKNLENVLSDEKFILFLRLVRFPNDREDEELDFPKIIFWELESEVEKVRDYMVSRNFVPILESLFNKYGDIGANSTLNQGTKTRFLNIFCGVVQSMCNTKFKDITRILLFNWWKNFKLVQHAGFNIQFAFDHLSRLAKSYICLRIEFDSDGSLFRNQDRIDDLTTELEELKLEQKRHIRSKKRKSILEKDRLIADIELSWKTAGTLFLGYQS